MKTVICLIIAAVFTAPATAGYTFEDVDVEYWAGLGSSRAMVILDFGSDFSYAFGYAWEGLVSPTSFDALVAIDAAGVFSMISHYDESVGGMAIDMFEYDGKSMGFFDMAFFVSDNGQDWSTSWDGASDRYLNDGSWDGWARGYWEEVSPGWYEFSGTPTVPLVTPEPSLMTLFGLGAVLIKRRK